MSGWPRASSSTAPGCGRWLTTVVARECLHMLRSRRRRREDPFAAHVPELVVIPDGDLGPEQEALLADAVSLALLVVLDQLTPAERLAFVLHDMFDLPFEEIAGIAGRTPAAAQLASRARRRVHDAEIPSHDLDLARQRQVVRAFYAAAWNGDFDALVQVLDPDVVLRTEFGTTRSPTVVRGAPAVAKQARAPRGGQLRPAVVNGAIGTLITRDGRPFSLMAFTVAGDKIVRIDVAIDPGVFRGVLPLPLSTLKATGPFLLNPRYRGRAITLTFDQFKYGWTNALDEDEARRLYDTYHVAGSGIALAQMGNANLNPWTESKVDTKNPDRGPLLILDGEKDHTVPWAIANASYKQQKRNPSVTEIKKMPNRGHSLTIDHGWQEVAQTALDFVKRFGPAKPG